VTHHCTQPSTHSRNAVLTLATPPPSLTTPTLDVVPMMLRALGVVCVSVWRVFAARR
jgi:hypothetical protein